MSADLIAIIAAALLFVAGYSIHLRLRAGRRRRKFGARITELTQIDDTRKGEEVGFDVDELFRQLEGQRKKGVVGFVQNSITNWLRPAGGKSALRPVIIMSLISGAIGAILSLKVLGMPPTFAAAVSVALALFVPHAYVKNKSNQRRDKFLDTFPDAIDLVVRAIKAGIPTSESIATAGRELPEPLGGEFRRIAQEVAIGVAPDRALSEAAERVRVNDFNFFAVTLMLQRETGGNLAETLENLSALLRKRKEMRLKVKALTSEGRFTSKVVGGLPILVMVALFFLNRDYVTLLFTDPVSQIFLGIAVAFVAIGSIVMNKLVDMDI